ncbi:HAD hydrolase-like protein [Candidatus Dependentiae bacterium]
MSKSFLIAVLIIFSTILYVLVKKFRAKHITPVNLIKYKPITPKNTIIAFDLHDVIVNYDYIGIIKTFFASNGKLRLILAMLNPLVWRDIIKLIYNHAVAEQYIVWLGKKHKRLEPYIPLGIKIANCQIVNQEVLAIIKELKKYGYTLHLFSNIGTVTYKDFKQKHPEIFQYFDDVILPSQENGYLRKPNHNAFVNYLENKKTPKNQIIFIDDKVKNVKKAEKYGIIGILFENHGQLVQELQKLGILKN